MILVETLIAVLQRSQSSSHRLLQKRTIFRPVETVDKPMGPYAGCPQQVTCLAFLNFRSLHAMPTSYTPLPTFFTSTTFVMCL